MEIIAEIGQNHNGDIDLAMEMIEAAKANGADVVKFQVYDAKKLFPKDGNIWFDYNCKTELKRDDVKLLAKKCQSVGVEFMTSVFDIERIGWLEDVGVKRYKVASRSVYDVALLARLCLTEKPLIVSLGMWKGMEFPKIESRGGVDFMHCVSNYPADLEDVKLSKIDFSKYIGLSDHTIGITTAIAAFSRGAKIVEKHFTLDKGMYGPDHACSMTPGELKILSEVRYELTRLL